MKRFFSVLFVFLALPVYAQNANQTQLRIVVVDESGLVTGILKHHDILSFRR